MRVCRIENVRIARGPLHLDGDSTSLLMLSCSCAVLVPSREPYHISILDMTRLTTATDNAQGPQYLSPGHIVSMTLRRVLRYCGNVFEKEGNAHAVLV